MAHKLLQLPPFAALHSIERPLSVTEYYHACVGRNPRSLIRQREVVFVIEGECPAAAVDWRTALDQAAAANPGARLRMLGKRQHARWVSDGQTPQVRILPECEWDGRSEHGEAFIYAVPLSLEEGRTAELIVAGRQQPKLIFRVLHAVMDGIGALHFLQDMFRALRGEPLLGSNATYSDSELMQSIESARVWAKPLQLACITGGVQGDQRGGGWRRITIPGPQPNLMARIVLNLVEYARRHSELPVRLAIPANLRRFAPQLLATTNFTSMPYIDFESATNLDLETVKARIKDIQTHNLDVNYLKIFELVRYLPFSWLDALLTLNEKNYTAPKLHESAVLTVLGAFKKNLFSGGGFSARCIYVLPQLDNVFITVTGVQGKFEICVGMPQVFASHGRMDALLDFLTERLTPGNE